MKTEKMLRKHFASCDVPDARSVLPPVAFSSGNTKNSRVKNPLLIPIALCFVMVFALCAAIALAKPQNGLSLFQPELPIAGMPTVPANKDPDALVPQIPTKPADTDGFTRYPDLTTLSFSQWKQQEDVIWEYAQQPKGDETDPVRIPLGSVRVDPSLEKKLSEYPEGVFAVMVDFSSMICKDTFLVDGVSLAAMEARVQELVANGQAEEAKKLYQKIREAREAYYFQCIHNFTPQFKAYGLGIYREKWGYTVDGCIFYTFATKEQIENLQAQPHQAFYLRIAVRYK